MAGGSPPDDRPVERVFTGRPAPIIVPAIAAVIPAAPAIATVAAAATIISTPTTMATGERKAAPTRIAREAVPAGVTMTGGTMVDPARVPREAPRHPRPAGNVATARPAGSAVHRLGRRGPTQCQACQTHPRQQRHRADQVSCACGHDVLPTFSTLSGVRPCDPPP